MRKKLSNFRTNTKTSDASRAGNRQNMTQIAGHLPRKPKRGQGPKSEEAIKENAKKFVHTSTQTDVLISKKCKVM